MTGNRLCLSNFHENHEGTVAFGAEGSKANVIDISQLCNQQMLVKSIKNKCLIARKTDELVLEGTKTFDNCYKLTRQTKCNKTGTSELEMWDFLGYSNNKAYRVYNKQAQIVESINVVVKKGTTRLTLEDEDLTQVDIKAVATAPDETVSQELIAKEQVDGDVNEENVEMDDLS
ncbi:hypothetical protein PVK06_022534 [Gossypium arboreum]|uniref:Uncharacterized protein n=1 Tax=Gossypium arboreum TaxID=29729 RepID=A0ABR0P8Q2_GOSAR|nr:hypothetical protein PVK06_022534 [Gossypium arboreum]